MTYTRALKKHTINKSHLQYSQRPHGTVLKNFNTKLHKTTLGTEENITRIIVITLPQSDILIYMHTCVYM